MPPHSTPPSRPVLSPENGAAKATTVKRLPPGAPGTKRLLERFGAALVCVRYRVDEATQRRFTTVELTVEERPAKPGPDTWVRIAYHEGELRSRVKSAGGTWDAGRQLWRLPANVAKALGLGKRIVRDIQ